MNLSLRPELQRFIDEQLKDGRYSTPEDLVTAALTRLMEGDADFDFEPGELQAMAEEGEADIARGNVQSIDEVREHFEARRSEPTSKPLR